jgi:Domain of unknown function (DUF4384)
VTRALVWFALFATCASCITPTLAQHDAGAKELLRNPDGEVVRRNAPTVVVKYTVEVIGVTRAPRPAAPSERLKTSDRVRLRVVSDWSGFIAVYAMENGSLGRLFPNREQGLVDNRLEVGRERLLPSDKRSFGFSGSPGVETLVLVFALKDDDLEKLDLSKLVARLDALSRGGKGVTLDLDKAEQVLLGAPGDVIVGKIQLTHG